MVSPIPCGKLAMSATVGNRGGRGKLIDTFLLLHIEDEILEQNAG